MEADIGDLVGLEKRLGEIRRGATGQLKLFHSSTSFWFPLSKWVRLALKFSSAKLIIPVSPGNSKGECVNWDRICHFFPTDQNLFPKVKVFPQKIIKEKAQISPSFFV
jgi:hypothetical protein